MWNWTVSAKCRVVCNGPEKKEIMINLTVDFRIIWGARTKKLLPQVDHKSPIFDRMCAKKETVECVDLQTWTFLFRSQVWTEREIRRERWQVFYGNRKKDPCTMISGLLEQQAVPSHQETQIMFICCRMASPHAPPHPPPFLNYFQIFPCNAVFLIFRTCYTWVPRARRSFTDHSELLDKDMLASSAGYLILHS